MSTERAICLLFKKLVLTPEEASDSIFICVHSFEEFLYRFWVENRLWFDLH
ncbi:hypothetical protein [Ktedonospora formicarum]|uniref:hypothetical protein n=1 Tax=Ktedonospora formicarum TaxID=2778364 RepID=UPI001C6932B4|nr:hypothetical protein [Ktedonospora formicarum]